MKSMLKVSSWSLSSLKLALAVTGLIVSAGVNASAQDQTVSGHLRVTNDTTLSGTLNVSGVAELNNNVTNFGANGANAAVPGLVLTYTDAASGTVSTITLATSGTTALWQWERNSANGLIPQMTLTSTNSIILWSPTVSNSVGIILNPAGDSTFSGSITATGTNSRLPNQQAPGTDTASILTQHTADGLYLKSTDAAITYIPASATSLGIGSQNTASGARSYALGTQNNTSNADTYAVGHNNSVSGGDSMALGRYNTVTGGVATAIGSWNTASNYGSVAIGEWASSTGWLSFSLGHCVTASGSESLAFGAYTTASGVYSMTMGYSTTASGQLSSAAGFMTVAQGYNQFVVGRNNIPQGDPNNWVPTDDLFVVGNGLGDPWHSGRTFSNAFVVKKNGDTSVNGNAAISGGATIVGQTTAQGRFYASADATFRGQITAEGPIRITPQGDITMGDFTSGSFTTPQTALAKYANTLYTSAGVTLSSAESANIAAFLSGLDQIVGLDTVVECWTLRSTQNAGSGTTAYGMLGRYNGTIVGNPGRNGDGMAFSGADQINFSANIVNGKTFTLIGVGRNTGIRIIFAGGIGSSFFGISQGTFLGRDDYDQGATLNINGENQNAFYASVVNNGSGVAYQNASALGSFQIGTNVTFRYIAHRDGYGQNSEGTVAFVMALSTPIDAAVVSNINALYKSTIGQGLNLP